MLYDFLTATDVEEVEETNRKYFEFSGKSADAMEGVMSFLQKREPEWSMKIPDDMPDF